MVVFFSPQPPVEPSDKRIPIERLGGLEELRILAKIEFG